MNSGKKLYIYKYIFFFFFIRHSPYDNSRQTVSKVSNYNTVDGNKCPNKCIMAEYAVRVVFKSK